MEAAPLRREHGRDGEDDRGQAYKAVKWRQSPRVSFAIDKRKRKLRSQANYMNQDKCYEPRLEGTLVWGPHITR